MKEPAALYTRRVDGYERFVRLVGYPQGLRACFLHAPWLRSGLRVLDAGCGSGLLSLALLEALERRGLASATIHGFDLTPAMLERFRDRLLARGMHGVELAQADLLDAGTLPPAWHGYDLVISAAMFEYLPRRALEPAFATLASRLNPGGRILLFASRRNALNTVLIARWWKGRLYGAEELRRAMQAGGFDDMGFARFPWPFRYLGLWGHVVEARRAVRRSQPLAPFPT